ncbi:hypothetical protein H9Y04_44395 [Streptomyces sp. TRM66268-LWL]|uniref:Uncharacterized protein n=1 Tax=Streptomyces polyasparticus TaxID=2767826 RepID=A0ABR7SVX9_9ACTN|nr:hypothetical protein [Streptomyces polyasparticus]MBC9719553.1 hypothetical protein [Streptomyces polyasparticus]
MASKNAPPILVLHDLDTVKEELTAALETADPQHRTGLEEALRIVDRHSAVSDDERTREWARRLIRDAGIDAARDQVRAVKAVRDAVPGLGLIAANSLVNSIR